MYSKAMLVKAKLAAAAVVAAAAMVAGPSALGQSCAGAGCDITGITVPNGFVACPGAGGANVHDPTKFNKATQLCNNGPINPATWVYGPENDLTAAQQAAPYWNVVATKMSQGLPVFGTRWSNPDGSDYCAAALYNDATNHFTWADEFHAPLINSVIWNEWETANGGTPCGYTFAQTAVQGVMGSSLDEREAQHDGDGSGILMIRPVESVADAQEAIFWNFWPPFGHRSQGITVSRYNTAITATGSGGYRQSYNLNIVMIAQIGTVSGALSANGIAALDGIDALYLDDEDLAFQSQGVADYDTLANMVESAAINNGKYLCTVNHTAQPEVMSCLPPAPLLNEAAIVRREWRLRRLGADGQPFSTISSTGSSPIAKE